MTIPIPVSRNTENSSRYNDDDKDDVVWLRVAIDITATTADGS
jgi:hypothetical protein